ncbi:hypothetical protein AB0I22_07940 [Streptomyces sp. NPDC050610]|uniref:hypothetical protein n=1 Tax=Streptomyces sp. NPDC050610 TaxID=3157097 RepID=UPI00343E2BCF
MNIDWMPDAVRADTDGELKERGHLSTGAPATGHLSDSTWKAVVRGIRPGTE